MMFRQKLDWFRALPIGLAFGLIVLSFVRRIFRIPAFFSFAQGAEDILILHIATYNLGITGPGNYVDVGCNRPVRYSNTFDLYLRGWRGINIDANKRLVEECKRIRKQDICLHAAVSDAEREVTFHKAKSDLVSTIDERQLVEWRKHFEFDDEERETVVTRTLTSILDEHWQASDRIDLLTVDVEGHDVQVLKGLDLEKYRPRMIVVELHEFAAIERSEAFLLLTASGYRLTYFAVLNAYFVDGRTEQ